MVVKIKLLSGGTVPTRGSREAAGYDIYAAENKEIEPMTLENIKTGVCLEMTPGHYADIRGRSGLASKRGLICIHGLIDSDYRGEIRVMLFNASNETQRIYKGNRIAQILFGHHEVADFDMTENLNETERGESGFGSTGV